MPSFYSLPLPDTHLPAKAQLVISFLFRETKKCSVGTLKTVNLSVDQPKFDSFNTGLF